MQGIERIIARVEADAESEIESILAEAKAEAGRIEEEYRAQGEALRGSLLAQAEQAAFLRRDRLVGKARAEGKRKLLAQRQRMVDEAYLAVGEKLCALPRQEAVEIMAALLCDASTAEGDEVMFSSADREQIGAEVVERVNAAGKYTVLSEKTHPFRGGFILSAGKVEINCTVEALIRLEKERSAAAVAKILFR